MVDLSAVEEYRDMMQCSWAEADLVMRHRWPDYLSSPDHGKRLMGWGIIKPHTVEIHWMEGGKPRAANYLRGWWEWATARRQRQKAAPRAVEGEEG